MYSSPRNRGTLGVDDPFLSDGFYSYRKFKARGKSGKSGKKLWRRAMRKAEKLAWVKDQKVYL